jgi:hypothetical protein
MPTRQIRMPVKNINGEEWAELSVLASTHFICAESFKITDNNFTAAGGHRVRLYAIKKNVHWKLPTTVVSLDIADVPLAQAPRRQIPNR